MSASTREEVVIKDACILFDLIDLGLLDHFYTLRLTVVTTPEVISEITDENQLEAVNRHIESGQLELDREGEYDVITGIIDLCPGSQLYGWICAGSGYPQKGRHFKLR